MPQWSPAVTLRNVCLQAMLYLSDEASILSSLNRGHTVCCTCLCGLSVPQRILCWTLGPQDGRVVAEAQYKVIRCWRHCPQTQCWSFRVLPRPSPEDSSGVAHACNSCIRRLRQGDQGYTDFQANLSYRVGLGMPGLPLPLASCYASLCCMSSPPCSVISHEALQRLRLEASWVFILLTCKINLFS